ncbi:cholecystokinin receptor-like [Lytechinus variegatus]|uniref:cholecystokinin receptor-like n=1 Tax=Lytechinus variegatus TaxID=7654 RepID=UPI001BB12AB5|nr:cholecystokinin receptor-like [Lytechinus variegatus]
MDATMNSTIAGTSTLKIVSTVVYSFLGSVGVVGNSLVLIVLISVKQLRNITNLFIINQSILDMIASLFLFANYIAPPLPLPDREWSGRFVCSIWNSGYLFWGTIISSTYNLVMLSIERYLAVIHPVVYRSKFSYRLAAAVVVSPWIIGFGYEVHWAAVNRYDDGQCNIYYASTVVQKFTGCLTFTVEFLLPIAVMAFVYINIGKSLRQRIADINHSTTMPSATAESTVNNGNNADDQSAAPNYREKARKNVIKTLLIVCVTYAVCWAPNQVTYLYFNLGGALDFNGNPY